MTKGYVDNRELYMELEEEFCYKCNQFYEGAICIHSLQSYSINEAREAKRKNGCKLELLAPKDKLNKIYGK